MVTSLPVQTRSFLPSLENAGGADTWLLPPLIICSLSNRYGTLSELLVAGEEKRRNFEGGGGRG